MSVPARYLDRLQEVAVDCEPVVITAVGPRSAVGYRWKCLRCGQLLKRNTAGAQSHIAKHVREATKEQP
jgi:hypothetical protein